MCDVRKSLLLSLFRLTSHCPTSVLLTAAMVRVLPSADQRLPPGRPPGTRSPPGPAHSHVTLSGLAVCEILPCQPVTAVGADVYLSF